MELTETAPSDVIPVESAAACPPAMSADEVATALTYIKRGTSPRRALEAALGMPDELTPLLVNVLALAPVEVQSLCDNPPGDDTTFYLHEIAMYLLAAWREPRGWSLILDFHVSDDDLAQELLGISASADLPALLVRCYDGSDLSYFERIIETDSFDGLFRQACLQTYHGLVLTGQAPRDRFIAFLARLLDAPADAEPGDWYDWLAFRSAQVQEPTLRPAIEAVLDRGLTVYSDSFLCLISRENLDTIYADDPHGIAGDILHDAVFDELVDSICSWSWFTSSEPVPWPPRLPAREAGTSTDSIYARSDHSLGLTQYASTEPYIRAQPKRGRNEPCHCGSGKKYKKCCLSGDERQQRSS